MGFFRKHKHEKYQPLSSTSNAKYAPNKEGKFEKITLSSIPWWSWTTDQCRDWLQNFCVRGLSIPEKESEAISEKFEGLGANLYLKKIAEWKDLLGEARGKGMYWYLLTNRHEVVPQHIHLVHGWKETRETD